MSNVLKNHTVPYTDTSEANPAVRLQLLLSEQIAMVDRFMQAAAQSDYASLIPNIINHLTNAGGKRIRPLLTLACAELTGVTQKGQENAARLGAAVEYIHSATLLHDDVIDASMTRRGLPTANSIWGNKASILVGDYLFSQAFGLMVGAGSIQALEILAQTSAVISESEVWQLQLIGDFSVQTNDYLRLIDAKTASLFAAACAVGALAATASPDVVKKLQRYGWVLGMIFQIIDDVLDYSAQHPKFGKAVGGDFYEGKITCVVLALREKADPIEYEWLQAAFASPERTPEQLKRILELIAKYKVIEAARAMTRPYIEEGVELVRTFPQHPLTNILDSLLDYTAAREY